MGNVVRRAITRPIRTYNIENRAQKVIEKDKPVQAPRHEGKAPSLPDAVQEEIRTKIVSKSEKLDNRLRDVKVVSEGVNPEIKRAKDNLPQDRDTPAETLYGFVEPTFIPKGKVSLSQTIELLTKHGINPKEYKAEQAAKEYGLELQDAKLILEYYMPLTTLDPSNEQDMARIGLKTREQLLLEETHHPPQS